MQKTAVGGSLIVRRWLKGYLYGFPFIPRGITWACKLEFYESKMWSLLWDSTKHYISTAWNDHTTRFPFFSYYYCRKRFTVSSVWFISGRNFREPKVVQLFLLRFQFCVRYRILDFQFTAGFLPFWDLEKFYLPEGGCECSS